MLLPRGRQCTTYSMQCFQQASFFVAPPQLLPPRPFQFGTRFEEMDAERGRQQTTKGVWMAKSSKVGDICTLVMDLEGSDGRERCVRRRGVSAQGCLGAGPSRRPSPARHSRTRLDAPPLLSAQHTATPCIHPLIAMLLGHRGEDDTNFERQSALFALAVADVLLVNIWCHDIGREQGSGKPLMKTIFQV